MRRFGRGILGALFGVLVATATFPGSSHGHERETGHTRAQLAVLLSGGLQAREGVSSPPLIAGASYDPAVPTVASVLGHASGDRITTPADLRRYFEALKAYAPDRVMIGPASVSHEGREVFWVAIGSSRNMARLDQIRANARALADPRRTTRAQAAALIADQPVVVWLMSSVHGDEISPADASLATAYHLLASRDPAVQAWLSNTLVVFTPSQNPDGRNRFLNSFDAAFGTRANPDPLSAERDQPWPGGRYNHDLFDLNRDWFIQTQPETRGQAALIREWRPQVVVDAHEMGTDQTFFFPPEAQPLNPWIAPSTLESREILGRNTARRFDEAGEPYFTRQVFDAFYPGYGDGWPGYLGAISMTYEQGSARGLIARRSSGEILTYRDTVRNHTIAFLATIEGASENHGRLLGNFYDYHADGVAGRGAYVLSRNPADAGSADRLVGLLLKSGIEVGQAEAGFSACGQSYPAGTYLVNLSQPQRRMAEVLLAREVAVPADFLAEQERRRARGLPDEIYDVTAWSLPLLLNTPAQRCGSPITVTTRPVSEATPTGGIEDPSAAFGYLIAPGRFATGLMAAGLQEGLVMRSMNLAFTHNGRRWPAGTLVIARTGNPSDLTARMQRLVSQTGAQAVGIADSWVSDGPSFGSGDAVPLRAPRVALAWDEPTEPTAVGATRYVLERSLGYPVTVVRTANLGRADLGRFDVIILPNGGDYRGVLGSGGVAHLKDWVEQGGVLIGLGSATRLLTDPASALLASRRETASGGEAVSVSDKARVAGQLLEDEAAYDKLVHAGERGPDSVAGVLARVDVDPEHWLSAGVAPRLNVLVRGADIYTPLTRAQGTNVARFPAADQLLASGQLWDENRQQLAFKPAIMAAPQGSGWVVAFAQDPTFRGYMEGLEVIFANAVFRGPAQTSR